ncbi:hypothetical protein B1M_30395 [Burkholderia sp. TJI49]|nr:hypothetical protein B1M_30395 [Burkholderia sp. TJI49]
MKFDVVVQEGRCASDESVLADALIFRFRAFTTTAIVE